MKLTERHKLMLIFLSRTNPLLPRMQAFREGRRIVKVADEAFLEMTGISRMTLSNWARGNNMRESTAERVFSNALRYLDRSATEAATRDQFEAREYEYLRVSIVGFQKMYADAEMDIYDIAKILGTTTAQCQQAIDDAIYHLRPLLPWVYYPEAPRNGEADYAQLQAAQYEGIYLVWLRSGRIWLQCTLRVRNLQEAAAGRFLRCKMNFPVADQNSKARYFEYDGFLSIHEATLSVTLEKRRPGHDHCHLMTNIHSNSGVSPLILSGQYLMASQDQNQSIVTGALLMHRIFNDDGTDPLHLRYREIMRNEARLLSTSAEIQEAEERWQRYGPRSEDRP